MDGRSRIAGAIERRRTGLWRHDDFMRVWGAQTVSIFGSLVTRIALPFLAILELNAGPVQLAILHTAELLPAFLTGLFAGVWVDRLPRRQLMIASDLGRAAALLAIPVAAATNTLNLPLVYIVTIVLSVLGVLFEVAYQAYLPSLVGRQQLLEANAKMAGSSYVVETPAFSVGGWLVQLAGAPAAMLIDTVSFLGSAWLLARVRVEESLPAHTAEREHVFREAADGLRYVWKDASLRAMALSNTLFALAFSLTSAVFLLYLTTEIGLDPGIQGMIFAIGGFASLLGAVFTRRLSGRFGVGPLLIGSMTVVAITFTLPPLARDATVIGVGLLVAQQLIMDPFWGIFEIVGMSTRQGLTDDAWLGRMNATFRVTEFGAMLAGTLLGGWVGSAVGLRETLWLSVVFAAVSVLPLLFSPVRSIRTIE